MEHRSIEISLFGAERSWPLLLSAIIHLALICICCVPETSGVKDCIMVELISSGSALPGTGGRNGNTGSRGKDRGKQAPQFPTSPSSPHRRSRKPERRPATPVSTGPEHTAATSFRSTPEPAMRQATGVEALSAGVTTPVREGNVSGASFHGAAGRDTGANGTGGGHGAGHGGDGAGKGESSNGKGDGDGKNGPVDGVVGVPGGPSFATRVTPAYPPFARRIGKEGTVLLRLSLDGNGHLKGVNVVKKAGFGFDEAALAAAKASTYRPAVRHDRPAPCRALLSIRFELEE